MIDKLRMFKKLQNIYQPRALDFELCTGYLAQATRNEFNMDIQDDAAVVYTKRDLENSQYVIVASSGKDRESAIERTAHKLSESSGRDVIVKNVGIESRLVDLGFEEYGEDETWDAYSKHDDNTFPEIVVRVEKYLPLKGSQFRPLREELNRFERNYSLYVKPYKDAKDFNTLLNIWTQQLAKTNGLDEHELRRSHQMFGEIRKDWHQFVAFDSDQDGPIGFLSLSPVSKICLGGNALISDSNYDGLCRRLIHEIMVQAKRLGYSHVNLQGSEDENQHRSKGRFRGREIRKRHMVYRKK